MSTSYNDIIDEAVGTWSFMDVGFFTEAVIGWDYPKRKPANKKNRIPQTA